MDLMRHHGNSIVIHVVSAGSIRIGSRILVEAIAHKHDPAPFPSRKEGTVDVEADSVV